jgi:hypothetical protein
MLKINIMNIRKKTVIKEEDKDFVEEIVKVFQKYPEMKVKYSISSRKPLNKLLELKKEGQFIVQRWEGNKIIIELVDNLPKDKIFGCCRYCVDDDGNTYCCESGDDC